MNNSVLLLVLILSIAPFLLRAQEESHRIHVVKTGETLFSISRQYEVSLKDIIDLNHLDVGKLQLQIGDTILIPEQPLHSKQANLHMGDTEIHIVQEGETLYSIAKLYPGVTVEALREINHLEGYQIAAGQQLIIRQGNKPSANFSDLREQPRSSEKPQEEINSNDFSEDISEEKDSAENAVAVPSDSTIVQKQNPQPVTGFETLARYFKLQMYRCDSLVTQKTIAVKLERNPGADRKLFYAMSSSIPFGTVIRIKNPMNSRVAYVKILGAIPASSESRNISLQLSYDAAEYLAIRDKKFIVEVSWCPGLSKGFMSN